MEDEKGDGPQYLAHGVLKSPGTVHVAWRRKGPRVTWLLVILFRVCKHKAP